MLLRIGCVSARNSCRHRCNMSDRFTRTVYSTSHARTVQYTQSRVMLRWPRTCYGRWRTRRAASSRRPAALARYSCCAGRRTPICTPGGCRRHRSRWRWPMLLPRRGDALPYAHPEDAGGAAPKTPEVVVEGIQRRQQTDVHAYSLRSHTEQRDSEGEVRSGRIRTVGLRM